MSPDITNLNIDQTTIKASPGLQFSATCISKFSFHEVSVLHFSSSQPKYIIFISHYLKQKFPLLILTIALGGLIEGSIIKGWVSISSVFLGIGVQSPEQSSLLSSWGRIDQVRNFLRVIYIA